MKRIMILGPKESPFIKTYNNKDTIVAINKYTGATELMLAKEASPYDHLLVTNGITRDILITISSSKEISQNDIIKIVNHMPI